MKWARLCCFLIILGSSAIAAHAQTPVDPSSANDAGPRVVTPDGCSPPYCFNFTYEGGANSLTSQCGSITVPVFGSVGGCVFFLELQTPILVTPGANYGCQASGSAYSAGAPPGVSEIPIFCTPVFNDPKGNNYFDGALYFVPGAFVGETFGGSVVGGSLGTFDAISTWSCQGGCGPGGTWDPLLAPEPGTSLLFMSGLLLFSLGPFARKRFGTTSRT
jgi:hypothetical protein